MAWIRQISDDEAEGPLKRHFDSANKRAGRVFGIVRVMSLEPRALSSSMALYQATTTSPEVPLSRWLRELIAVRVSRLNQCHY
ncbi:MAG: hypothetical protein AAF196_05710 [Planctomycetota bacterium]